MGRQPQIVLPKYFPFSPVGFRPWMSNPISVCLFVFDCWWRRGPLLRGANFLAHCAPDLTASGSASIIAAPVNASSCWSEVGSADLPPTKAQPPKYKMAELGKLIEGSAAASCLGGERRALYRESRFSEHLGQRVARQSRVGILRNQSHRGLHHCPMTNTAIQIRCSKSLCVHFRV
jgi:hypothetical protein